MLLSILLGLLISSKRFGLEILELSSLCFYPFNRQKR